MCIDKVNTILYYIVKRYIATRYIGKRYIESKVHSMNKYPALTETVFYILLSLSKPLHGYAIMQNIKTLTHGRINMGAGTLYGALSVLVEKEYITEVKSDDLSKRLYVRTELGTEIIENEIRRLEELTQNANLYFNREEI